MLTHQELLQIESKLDGVQSLASSPEFLAQGNARREVSVSNRQGEVLWKHDLREDDDRTRSLERIRVLEFSVTGEALYVGCGNWLYCFEAATGNLKWQFRPESMFGFILSSPLGVVPEENGVWVLCDSGTWFKLTNNGNVKTKWKDPKAPTHIVATNEGVLGTDGWSLDRIDIPNRKARRLIRPDEKIHSLDASPDDSVIAARGIHKFLLGDRRQGEPSWTVLAAPHGLPLLAVAESGGMVAVGGLDRVFFYQASGELVGETAPREARLTSLRRDGAILRMGWSDGEVTQDESWSGIL